MTSSSAPAQVPVPAREPPPLCPRCARELVWIHSSWQCTACRYKEGCCG